MEEVSDQNKLYVGGFSLETTKETLRAHFEKYGTVLHSIIVEDQMTNMARCFAFVTFSDSSGVESALKASHELCGMTVENVIKAQPWLHDMLLEISSCFLNTVHTMYQQYSSSPKVLSSTANLQDQAVNQHPSKYLEVVNSIDNAIVNLDAFVVAYNHAAISFCVPVKMSHGIEKLLATLAKVHDALLPCLKGFVLAFRGEMSSDADNVLSSINVLSTRIVHFGWKLLDFCYLGDKASPSLMPMKTIKMFPANVEDPWERAEILVQTLRECSDSSEGYLQGSFLQKIEKHHELFSKVEFLESKGWFSINDDQKQFVSDILGHFFDPFSRLDLGVFDTDQKVVGVKSGVGFIMRLWQGFTSRFQRQEGQRRGVAVPQFQPPTPNPFPWLLITHGKSRSERKTSFYSIANDMRYVTSAPEVKIKGKWVICSCNEWVVVYDARQRPNARLSTILLSLTSSQAIPLPDYQLNGDEHYDLELSCVMTAPPTERRKCVVLLFSISRPTVLIWWGGQSSWTEQNYGEFVLQRPSVCKGVVYGFLGPHLGVCRTIDGKLRVQRLALEPKLPVRYGCGFGPRERFFLVGSNDNLFMVRVIVQQFRVLEVNVLKLMSRRNSSERIWKIVLDIGSQALFINAGISQSYCCSVSPGSSSRVKANCVYFASLVRQKPYLLLRYDLATDRMMYHGVTVKSKSPACFLMVQPE